MRTDLNRQIAAAVQARIAQLAAALATTAPDARVSTEETQITLAAPRLILREFGGRHAAGLAKLRQAIEINRSKLS